MGGGEGGEGPGNKGVYGVDGGSADDVVNTEEAQDLRDLDLCAVGEVWEARVLVSSPSVRDSLTTTSSRSMENLNRTSGWEPGTEQLRKVTCGAEIHPTAVRPTPRRPSDRSHENTEHGLTRQRAFEDSGRRRTKRHGQVRGPNRMRPPHR